ncbi:MAG: family 16 glycosylhydrolase [Planctomycetota bacterium]
MILGATTCTFVGHASAQGPQPPLDGLVVWLDATYTPSLDTDGDKVLAWSDRRGEGQATLGTDAEAPRRIEDAINGKNGVRFDGKSYFQWHQLADRNGPVAAFVVFQRTPEQAGDVKWQRLISSWDGSSSNDTQPPSFFIDTGESGGAVEPTIESTMVGNAKRGDVLIGRNASAPDKEYLQGDIGEVLIYDTPFLVFEQVENVKAYLREKWDIPESGEGDWTLVGPPPTSPTRTSDLLPLSDQENAGNWRPFDALWDEFDGEGLNEQKWWDHNPHWYGRAPARFLPRNVSVSDGQLHLKMRYEPDLEPVQYYPNGLTYETFSSASVVSKIFCRYGYYEVRARAMDSAGSSSFWFYSNVDDANGGSWRTEIDVFELGGKAIGHETNYNMNAHVFETPQRGKDHTSHGGKWVSPYRWADDYHVFGLEWTPDTLNYYVNGVLVRRMPNTHWHSPLRLLFDSETMGNWLGMPEIEDLPSTFSVDYIRAWVNDDTEQNFGEEYPEPAKGYDQPTEITAYLRAYERGQPIKPQLPQ